MEKRMEQSLIYNGTITAEQFLFYEIRIASKYYLDGASVEDAIEEIKKNKIKQVLTKILVEVEILDTFKSTRLNPLFLCEELEEGIRRNNDLEALAAFNCFR